MKVQVLQQVLNLLCGSVLASSCREMRNKRVTDRQKLCKSVSLSFLLAHNVTFKVQSLHNKSQLHFFGNIALNTVLWTCYQGIIEM